MAILRIDRTRRLDKQAKFMRPSASPIDPGDVMPFLICRVKSLHEQIAQRHVEREAGTSSQDKPRFTYIPKYFDEKARQRRNLFACYLFVDTALRINLLDIGPIIYVIKRVGSIHPDTLPDELIQSWRDQEDEAGTIYLQEPMVRIGDQVRISQMITSRTGKRIPGPLFGLQGIFQGMTSSDRVAVLLSSLGKVTVKAVDVTPV